MLVLVSVSDFGSDCTSSWSLLAVMIQSFWTDWSGQIVQTQIRLLLEAQSDKGLHHLQYYLHLLDALLNGKTFFLARLHEVQKSYCSHPGRTRSRSRSRSTLR